MRFRHPSLVAACCLLPLFPAKADVIILKNGENIVGTIVREDEEKYVVEVKVTGTIRDEKIIPRAEVVRIKSEAFVESARVMGASNFRIMTRHVLRNSTRTLPLILTLNASESILTLAGLGFLGFGIEQTEAAEWGYDLNKSLSDVTSGIWWTSVFPGAAIVLVVLGLTLVGESLNDLADPRLRKRVAGAEPVEDLGVDIAPEVAPSDEPTTSPEPTTTREGTP